MISDSSADHEDPLLLDIAAELRSAQRGPAPMRIGADGRFILGRELGRGSMGSVFAAHDTVLGREVAIKLPHSASSSAQVEFEARALACLNHENVVRIFDVGTWDGIPFLVLERLAGESLANRLKSARLECESIRTLIASLLRGLACVHDANLVHRDLKPSNLFLTERGTLKILDFGLARASASPHEHLRLLADELASIGGDGLVTAGSPAYMAPEQWRGEAQDQRTDIWTVGVLLFQLLTGRLPFESNTIPELQTLICSDLPAPRLSADDVRSAPALRTLVEHCLQKAPDARFASARQALRALEGAEPHWHRLAPSATEGTVPAGSAADLDWHSRPARPDC
jgi:serine/threonine protein kinase